MVWHGADALGARDMENYCDAWHSGAPARYGLASSLLGQARMLGQERHSCASSFIVLCVEVTSQQEYDRDQEFLQSIKPRRKRNVDGNSHGQVDEQRQPLVEPSQPVSQDQREATSPLKGNTEYASWEPWFRSAWAPEDTDQQYEQN